MLTVNVTKHFTDRQKAGFSLDVSFSAADGITVLTGASGSGKTTILRIVAGVLTPDEGVIKSDSEIFFDSTRKIDLPIQKRRIGFVFQDYALFPHLTAKQNIAYGVRERDEQLVRNKVEEALALFHIEHVKNRIPREMSGGEQQRVALARALASDPRIVLLDEPLSAVDTQTRARLLDEIESAQARAAIPFIYVTHNQEEADRLGKQRIKLDGGRIVN